MRLLPTARSAAHGARGQEVAARRGEAFQCLSYGESEAYMMELRKIDPTKNMRRFYPLSVEPTLFGDFSLVREWGRIDAKGGQIKKEWLP